MSQEIAEAYVKQYSAGIRMLQQQKPSRIMDKVSMDHEVTGDRAFYEQYDATFMTEITNRHGDTEYTDTPHRRRMVTLKPFEVADLVDRLDKRRILNDPINDYTKNFAAAANRKTDDIIMGAFFATANTGVDGGTPVVFDTAFDASNGGNFRDAELIDARELLEAAENDDEQPWYIACSADQRAKLLSASSVTNTDFNVVRALVNGQINTWLGLEFVKSQRAPLSGTSRSVPIWVKDSMKCAMSQNPTGFMDVLPEKRHSIQVRYELDAGATRMDEKGVVRIIATES